MKTKKPTAQSAKLALAKYLSDLGNKKKEPRDRRFGICFAVNLWLRSSYFSHKFSSSVLRKSRLEKWEHFSGSVGYPVKHNGRSASNAYNCIQDLWTNTAYGNRRRDLCKHLAKTLRAEVRAGNNRL